MRGLLDAWHQPRRGPVHDGHTWFCCPSLWADHVQLWPGIGIPPRLVAVALPSVRCATTPARRRGRRPRLGYSAALGYTPGTSGAMTTGRAQRVPRRATIAPLGRGVPLLTPHARLVGRLAPTSARPRP